MSLKAETIQRLLQKQPTKKKEDGNGGHKRARVEGPAFSYRDSIVNGITISFPKEVESPFVAQKITKRFATSLGIKGEDALGFEVSL